MVKPAAAGVKPAAAGIRSAAAAGIRAAAGVKPDALMPVEAREQARVD